MASTEGKVKFSHQGEAFETYYKLFGNLKESKHTPLVVLHGGPGLVHEYLLPIADLATKYEIPVVFYDQLGNGKSTHLREKPGTFWTVDLFIDELVNLLEQLSISDNFSILGHSWGGILASELEVRRQPAGLKRLILSDSLAASSLWNKSTVELVSTFPPEVQQGMAGGMKDPAKFYAALNVFYAVYGCTVKPFPKEYVSTLDQVFGPNGDPTVASAPILKDWTVIDRLHLVRVPTFVINGRKDLAQDYVVQPFFDKIEKVKWVTFENSSHTPFVEEQDKYMKLAADFLKA